MTGMDWVMACALGASILFAAVGALAFWPEWPPIEPGVHRAKPDPANPPHPAPAPLPVVPGPDEWTWTTDEAKRTRPRHRHEDIGEGTQRLKWYEVPSGPQPIHPPAPPVE